MFFIIKEKPPYFCIQFPLQSDKVFSFHIFSYNIEGHHSTSMWGLVGTKDTLGITPSWSSWTILLWFWHTAYSAFSHLTPHFYHSAQGKKSQQNQLNVQLVCFKTKCLYLILMMELYCLHYNSSNYLEVCLKWSELQCYREHRNGPFSPKSPSRPSTTHLQ